MIKKSMMSGNSKVYRVTFTEDHFKEDGQMDFAREQAIKIIRKSALSAVTPEDREFALACVKLMEDDPAGKMTFSEASSRLQAAGEPEKIRARLLVEQRGAGAEVEIPGAFKLYGAAEAVKLAEKAAGEAEKLYMLAIKTGQDHQERRAAYTALTEAKQKQQAAQVELVKLQEAGGVAETSPIDAYEAADKATREELKKAGVQRGGTLDALQEARMSLTHRESLALAERVRAYGEIFEHTLRDDRGFYLFADAVERLAAHWLRERDAKVSYGFDKKVEGLRKSLAGASDPVYAARVEGELKTLVEDRDQEIDRQIQSILAVEIPEVADLFQRDRTQYNLRKVQGRKLLFG